MALGNFLVEKWLAKGKLKLSKKGFYLNSGRESHHFFDVGEFNTGDDITELAKEFASRLAGKLKHSTVLLGPPYKGTLLVPAIVTVLKLQYNINVRFATFRKESKLHGEKGRIIGHSLKCASVIVVDDAITAAGTFQETFKLIGEAGGRTAACFVAFDRQECIEEGDKETAAESIHRNFDVPVFSLATAQNLITVLEQKPRTELSRIFLPKILAYQKRYGVRAA